MVRAVEKAALHRIVVKTTVAQNTVKRGRNGVLCQNGKREKEENEYKLNFVYIYTVPDGEARVK